MAFPVSYRRMKMDSCSGSASIAAHTFSTRHRAAASKPTRTNINAKYFKYEKNLLFSWGLFFKGLVDGATSGREMEREGSCVCVCVRGAEGLTGGRRRRGEEGGGWCSRSCEEGCREGGQAVGVAFPCGLKDEKYEQLEAQNMQNEFPYTAQTDSQSVRCMSETLCSGRPGSSSSSSSRSRSTQILCLSKSRNSMI